MRCTLTAIVESRGQGVLLMFLCSWRENVLVRGLRERLPQGNLARCGGDDEVREGSLNKGRAEERWREASRTALA